MDENLINNQTTEQYDVAEDMVVIETDVQIEPEEPTVSADIVEYEAVDNVVDEVIEVDISESTGWTSGDPKYHDSLLGVDFPRQHPIKAITGLREELDELERLKSVHSDKFNVANYYEWSDNATYDDYGYFVSLVPGGTKIQICKGSDVFGVVVDGAGFVGGQDAMMPRGNNYGLVVTSGLVDIRCELNVSVGDCVVPNASGYAKKSESNYGYKVIARETKNGVEYAVIALGVQADLTNLIGAKLEYLQEQVDANYDNIISAVNVANQAYNKAETAEVSATVSSGDVEEALKEILGFGETLDEMEKTVASSSIVSAQAKAIADSAATHASSIRDEVIGTAAEALERANETMFDTLKLRDDFASMEQQITDIENQVTIATKAVSGAYKVVSTIDGVTKTEGIVYYAEDTKKYHYYRYDTESWDETTDPRDAGLAVAVAGLRVETDENSAKINNLVSWQGDTDISMARIEQKADANGAYIQSTVINIDRYAVGPCSQAYGFTLEQAIEFLEKGAMYAPTKDTEEEYAYALEAEQLTSWDKNGKDITKVYLVVADGASTYWYCSGYDTDKKECEWSSSTSMPKYKRSFTKYYLYKWDQLNDVGPYRWITVDKDYNPTDETNTSSQAVMFKTDAAPTVADGENWGYWYTDGDTLTGTAATYEPHTLYKWSSYKKTNPDGTAATDANGDPILQYQWVAVATLAGNNQRRAISQVRQEANSIVAEVTDAKGNLASLGARLTETESQVQMTAAWQENFAVGGRNLLKNSANNYQNLGFNHPSDAIGGKVDYVITDEIYKGCRIAKWKGSVAGSIGPYVGISDKTDALVIGETYTLSVWVKGDALCSLKYQNFAEGQTHVVHKLSFGTEWTRVYSVFKATQEHFSICFYLSESELTEESPYIYMCGLKLEKGSVATDWTPAPEDVDASIASVKASASENAADITSLTDWKSGKSSSKSIIYQTSTDENASVVISALRETENGTKEASLVLNTTDDGSALCIDADSINFTGSSFSVSVGQQIKSAVNDIEVGGTNLLHGTKTFAIDNGHKTGWENQGGFTFTTDSDGFTVVSKSASGATGSPLRSFYSPRIPATKGDIFTLSFWMKVDDEDAWDIDIPCILEGYPSYTGGRHIFKDLRYGVLKVSAVAQDGWKKYTFTFTFGDAWSLDVSDVKAQYFGFRFCLYRNGSLHFKKAKLERGNKVTDWTPAPEDTDTAINNIDIGGRNLLLESNVKHENALYPTKSYTLSQKPVVGETYTISLKGKLGDGCSSFTAYNSGGMIALVSLTSSNLGTDGVYRKTFKWRNKSGNSTANDTYVSIYAIDAPSPRPTSSIEWIKLEKGNKATDWSPAPEDQVEKTNIISSINASSEGVQIQGNKVNIKGLVTFESLNSDVADTMNTVSGWRSPDKTTIDGSKITTGTVTANQLNANALTSNNYKWKDSSGKEQTTGAPTSGFPTAGTFFNLKDGAIYSQQFKVDSSGNADFKGTIGDLYVKNGGISTSDGKMKLNKDGLLIDNTSAKVKVGVFEIKKESDSNSYVNMTSTSGLTIESKNSDGSVASGVSFGKVGEITNVTFTPTLYFDIPSDSATGEGAWVYKSGELADVKLLFHMKLNTKAISQITYNLTFHYGPSADGTRGHEPVSFILTIPAESDVSNTYVIDYTGSGLDRSLWDQFEGMYIEGAGLKTSLLDADFDGKRNQYLKYDNNFIWTQVTQTKNTQSIGFTGHLVPSANAIYNLGTTNSVINEAYIKHVWCDAFNSFEKLAGGLTYIAHVNNDGYRFGMYANIQDTDNMFLSVTGSHITKEASMFYVDNYGNVKAAGGTLVGSDKRIKNSITDIPNVYEQFYDSLHPVIYKYNEGTSDRIHAGMIAQEVEKSLLDVGLTTQDFAGVCYEKDKETDEKRGYTLRYTEFVPLNILEIQKLKKRVALLESKLNELENESSKGENYGTETTDC